MSRSLNLCHFGHEKFTLPRAAMVVVVKRFFIMYARPSTNARPHMPSFHTIQTRSFFLRGSNCMASERTKSFRCSNSEHLMFFSNLPLVAGAQKGKRREGIVKRGKI